MCDTAIYYNIYNIISLSPNKIEALMKYAVPRNIRQVESVLDLDEYSGKFVPIIAKPLNDLVLGCS